MNILSLIEICENNKFVPIYQFISGIVDYIKICIPILLIVICMLDLGKIVMSGKEDDIKKHQKILSKRLISGVGVFFVITIVSVIFGLIPIDNEGNTMNQCIEHILK